MVPVNGQAIPILAPTAMRAKHRDPARQSKKPRQYAGTDYKSTRSAHEVRE